MNQKSEERPDWSVYRLLRFPNVGKVRTYLRFILTNLLPLEAIYRLLFSMPSFADSITLPSQSLRQQHQSSFDFYQKKICMMLRCDKSFVGKKPAGWRSEILYELRVMRGAVWWGWVMVLHLWSLLVNLILWIMKQILHLGWIKLLCLGWIIVVPEDWLDYIVCACVCVCVCVCVCMCGYLHKPWLMLSLNSPLAPLLNLFILHWAWE